jgi:lysophospholipase L1-like esterase
MENASIIIFGDSIAYGAWDEEGGWTQRLRSFLEENFSSSDSYYTVYNLGIDAEYTETLIQRIKCESQPRIMKGDSIFIYNIGINDSSFIKNSNAFLTTKEKFEKNIQKIIEITKDFSTKIIFMGINPVEESKTNPIPWSKSGKSYNNERIKGYESILKKVCSKNNVHFIELFDKWSKVDYKKLLDDGIHPNSKGHEKIFQAVKKYLIENKII